MTKRNETDVPPVPPGAGESGTRLWKGIMSTYSLSPAEMEMLREAVRVSTLVDRLEASIVAGDLETVDRWGRPVASPAIVESRQQRAILLRLLASLRLPDEETGAKPGSREGARGAYGRATGRKYGSLNAVNER